ncbi:MAG: glycosyltransferase family 2 protein, partial [Anaerolineae bacterium]
MTPAISVIMAVYNGARYLREAVDSILNQTFTDFEFIIVDDGSTDETPAVLDEYNDPRIVRLRNAHNLGLTKSLNRGLHVARGRYIARQDADDLSYPA